MRMVLGLFLLISIGASQTVSAEFYELFQNGRQHPNYNEIVERVAPGDTLAFSDGCAYRIDGEVIRTKYTVIMPVSAARILRVARGNGERAAEYFISYLRGYPSLLNDGIAVPAPFNRTFEYICQERIAVKFLLADLIVGVNTGKRRVYDEPLLWTRLREFLLSTYRYSEIGDFNSRQLAWDGERWVLLDWLEDNVYASHLPFEGETLISLFKWEVHDRELQEFIAVIETDIQAARITNRKTCEDSLLFGFFKRLKR
jgi:hypothetical protein